MHKRRQKKELIVNGSLTIAVAERRRKRWSVKDANCYCDKSSVAECKLMKRCLLSVFFFSPLIFSWMWLHKTNSRFFFPSSVTVCRDNCHWFLKMPAPWKALVLHIKLAFLLHGAAGLVILMSCELLSKKTETFSKILSVFRRRFCQISMKFHSCWQMKRCEKTKHFVALAA